ncbi:hypothetical protein B0H14DRAFT_3463631 [Mycena olivaceomarginata]|nr:hypothetical protein B0H14DRAFT_3463631 [Mycena olivaceomarginata]
MRGVWRIYIRCHLVPNSSGAPFFSDALLRRARERHLTPPHPLRESFVNNSGSRPSAGNGTRLPPLSEVVSATAFRPSSGHGLPAPASGLGAITSILWAGGQPRDACFVHSSRVLVHPSHAKYESSGWACVFPCEVFPSFSLLLYSSVPPSPASLPVIPPFADYPQAICEQTTCKSLCTSPCASWGDAA